MLESLPWETGGEDLLSINLGKAENYSHFCISTLENPRSQQRNLPGFVQIHHFPNVFIQRMFVAPTETNSVKCLG